MKVLLISPPYEIEKYYGKLSKLAFVFPPVGLTYIAGAVRGKGHEVYIYDFSVEEKDFQDFITDFKPDFIGITCQTALFYSAMHLAKNIKKLFPNVPIVTGGAHVSYRPHDCFENDTAIDIVVRGEGEMTTLELLKYYEHKDRELKDIKGITYKQNGEIIDNPSRELINDLDVLPLPAIDLLPLEKYHVSPDNYIGGQVGLVATSRGCPYGCIFCACKEAFNRSYRPRGLDKVFEEIKYYIEEYNVSQLFVMDDCFTLDRKRTMAFCERMIETGYNKKVSWWCQSRADLADEELLRKMKEAGCVILSFGIESGVQRILNNIAKAITLKQIRTTVKLAKKIGFQPRGSFIIGLPTESFLDSLRTIFFALSLPLSQTKFGLATPFPGTRLWDIALSEGQVKDKGENWDRFTVWSSYSKFSPTYIPKGRKIWEMKMLQKVANTVFYLQPRVIWSFLKRIKNYSDFKYFIKSIIVFFQASFSKNK
jgi:anaerobic magnesium-protoporphyrin IX monomethyl ester cyclase